MTVLTIVFIAIAAFLFGFLLGNLNEPPTRPKIKPIPREDEDIKRLRQEYENFLNYDGSEQL